jgi:hypothetical protein
MGPKKSDICEPYTDMPVEARKIMMSKHVETILNIAIHNNKTDAEMIVMTNQSDKSNIVCGLIQSYGYLVILKKMVLTFNHSDCSIKFYTQDYTPFKTVNIKTENDIYNAIIAINKSLENTCELWPPN